MQATDAVELESRPAMSETFPFQRINSVEQFISTVKEDASNWQLPIGQVPWFRGQADSAEPLRPTVFRENLDEHRLTLTFWQRAPSLGRTPERDAWDEWLFLMRHVGVPTRLLDWTESALVALYFAVYSEAKSNPGIWMLHPLELNRVSIGERIIPPPNHKEISQRVALAFQTGEAGDLPIALYPTYVHERVRVQKSSFTIHGKDTRSFEELFIDSPLVEQGYFKKYVFDRRAVSDVLRDLKMLGITHTTIFPDLDGLGRELVLSFRATDEEVGARLSRLSPS